MHLNHVRMGGGRPLLLVHGLGGSWRSWEPVLAPLIGGAALDARDQDLGQADLDPVTAALFLVGDRRHDLRHFALLHCGAKLVHMRHGLLKIGRCLSLTRITESLAIAPI